LNKIHLAIIPCRPHSQTNRPGGFPNALTKVNVNQAEAFVFD
jgi:hypothetical protein